MKQTLKRIFGNFEEIIAGTFLIATTILVLLNVFLRYFLRTGIYWSEEVATGCFVWSVFVGAAAAFKHHMHVGIDMLVNRLKPMPQYIVKIIVDIVLILINGYITGLAIRYLKMSYRKPTPVLGISSAFISSSILVGFCIMAVYSVIFLIHDCKQTPNKLEVTSC